MNTNESSTWVQPHRLHALAAIAMIGIGLAWPVTLIDDWMDPERVIERGELWAAGILGFLGVASGVALLSRRRRVVLHPNEVVVEERVLGKAFKRSARLDHSGKFSKSYEIEGDTNSLAPTWFIRYQRRGETLELCRMRREADAVAFLRWLNERRDSAS